MLDEKDLMEISHLMSVLIENEVTPRFHLLAEGQRTILETLAPKSKVEELEDEVKFLKIIIRQLNEDVQKLIPTILLYVLSCNTSLPTSCDNSVIGINVLFQGTITKR